MSRTEASDDGTSSESSVSERLSPFLAFNICKCISVNDWYSWHTARAVTGSWLISKVEVAVIVPFNKSRMGETSWDRDYPDPVTALHTAHTYVWHQRPAHRQKSSKVFRRRFHMEQIHWQYGQVRRGDHFARPLDERFLVDRNTATIKTIMRY